MDYAKARAGAALGARLRRLSERVDSDAARAYAAFGVAFEQRWFGVLNQLSLTGGMTVGELAQALAITHVSVSQTRQSLEAKGLIASSPAADDARRRVLTLTDEGRALVERLAPLWAAFEAASAELDAEARGIAEALDRLEAALTWRSLLDRISSHAGLSAAADAA
jgi:DNA-binding MarR family transcriptional regulator